MTTTPATTWTAALDELEHRLRTAEALVGEQMPTAATPVAVFVPPDVLGPPTPEEAERAAQLLTRGDLTLAHLESASEVLADELSRPAQMPTATPLPSMIDTRV